MLLFAVHCVRGWGRGGVERGRTGKHGPVTHPVSVTYPPPLPAYRGDTPLRRARTWRRAAQLSSIRPQTVDRAAEELRTGTAAEETLEQR